MTTKALKLRTPVERLRYFIDSLRKADHQYLQLSEVKELFRLVNELKNNTGFDLLQSIGHIETIFGILVDKEVEARVPELVTGKTITDAIERRQDAAFEAAIYRNHYECAQNAALRLDQLRLWLLHNDAGNLHYVNRDGKIISAAGKDPEGFINDMSDAFTVEHKAGEKGVSPEISVPSGSSKKPLYDFKTLCRYEAVKGAEPTPMGVRIDREDGIYFTAIPLKPEDFERTRLLDTLTALVNIIGNTRFSAEDLAQLRSGLDERGDMNDATAKHIMRIAQGGNLLFPAKNTRQIGN